MNRSIQNERLLIEVADKGAELKRLYDKQNGRELLFDGDPKWWPATSPLLFPIVGALNEGKYLYKGQTYEIPMHGVMRFAEPECLAEEGASIVHRVLPNDAIRERYPFDFELEVSHTLKGAELIIGWKVTNKGGEPMPFSIGGHPGFKAPLNAGEGITDVKLCFERAGDVHYRFMDKNHHLTEQDRVLTTDPNGRVPLDEHFFDHDAYIFIDDIPQSVGLAGADGREYLRVSFPGFPALGIWARAGGAPYVCIEPWFGSDEPAGPVRDIFEKPGMLTLKPGKVFEASYRVEAL